MKLYAVYLGGTAPGATIEVHDLVFVAAPDIKSAFPLLKEKWFGDKPSAHIDAWIDLSEIDGYHCELGGARSPAKEFLYCVNVGSYRADAFGEAHDFFFLVGRGKNEVKARAKAAVTSNTLVHIDNLIEVDNIVELREVDGLHLRLTVGAPATPVKINHVYWPLTPS